MKWLTSYNRYVRLPRAELASCQHPGVLYMGLCSTPQNQILPLTSVKSTCEGEKPPAKPFQTHRALAGKESSSQQICSHSRETNLISSCTSRSDNIDASSETDLRLALGPGDFAIHFYSVQSTALKYVPSIDTHIFLLFQC